MQAGSVSEVKATLVALTGSLFINTTPAGAQLTLDGSAAGISPVTLPNITMGSHLLNVSKEGFVTQSIPVTITADQITTVNVVLLPSVNGLAGFLPFTVAAGVLVALLVARKRYREYKTPGCWFRISQSVFQAGRIIRFSGFLFPMAILCFV